MAEDEAYQWEDGSPVVRYPRERGAPITRAHIHAHTNTQTREGYTRAQQHSKQ